MSTSTNVPIAILGAGISGLSTSYHLDHRDAVIFEAADHYGGHVFSEVVDGFTWDDGPRLSFTTNEYVKRLFADCVDGEYEVIDTKVSNYYQGHWINHPAQTNLYQIPEPLRTRCLESFLESRNDDDVVPENYEQWLHQAMGPVFADTFPAVYTRKYWTTEPRNLDTDWVGNRVLKPDVDEVVNGAKGLTRRTTTHYLAEKESRYPSRGGFFAYTHRLAEGASIRYESRMDRIDFSRRWMGFADGSEATYGRLVSTIPLPKLIGASQDAPASVKEAAALLKCTSFLRVDVAVRHPARREETWLYVYDEDKLSTRVSVMEKFSPNNAPPGKTGIQVEVYGSEYRALPTDYEGVKRRVVEELVEMGLVDEAAAVQSINVKHVPQGNPIFDLNRRAAMAEIEDYLDRVGVVRVGRYGQWLYFMTDACVISGRRAANECTNRRGGIDAEGISLSSQG
jgi:protoporphyrinogen oxidase